MKIHIPLTILGGFILQKLKNVKIYLLEHCLDWRGWRRNHQRNKKRRKEGKGKGKRDRRTERRKEKKP